MIPLIVITGPTASGKTQLAIEEARRLGGEIINADSMQIYRHMDIGTAKPSLEEREGIPHHLMDIAEPTEEFSVARYADLAHRSIEEVHRRGGVPILTGGTGLYIDTVVQGIRFLEGGKDEAFRAAMGEIAQRDGGRLILHRRLSRIDPESAGRIHPSDVKRVIRALEIYHTTGKTASEQRALSRRMPSRYDAKLYAISMEREKLYERINARVERMFEMGLTGEVERLLKMGVAMDGTAMQAIGYRETAQFLKGECSLEQAKEAVGLATRRYAKRQMTWFRKNTDINWIGR